MRPMPEARRAECIGQAIRHAIKQLIKQLAIRQAIRHASNALGPAGLGHWTHQNSVRVHWICLISLEKVNAHLLT